jgi:hypothetical protein
MYTFLKFIIRELNYFNLLKKLNILLITIGFEKC